jgi:hypothetical protein
MKPDDPLIVAIDAALAGEWDRAHGIVQTRSDELSCWIHAVLHKIEGDASNSRYWYAWTSFEYTRFNDPREELEEIRSRIAEVGG